MFSISVRFIRLCFEAGSNEHVAGTEWPPHPARLFAGLVAVASLDTEDLEALQWLERLSPPTIHASVRVSESTRGNYVITNETEKGRSHMEFPGRSARGRRVWCRVFPSDPTVSYLWDGHDPAHTTRLAGLCRRLPYLGRSTSPVVAWVDENPAVDGGDEANAHRAMIDPPEETPLRSADIWTPAPSGSTDLTVPSDGFLHGLVKAHSVMAPAWTVNRAWCRYRSPLDEVPQPLLEWESPYSEMVVFAIERPGRPSWHSLVRYTTAFRAATIKHADQAGFGAGPVELHGHTGTIDDVDVISSTPQPLPKHRVMFLGLPFVGSEHADGHLLGFAVCLPREMASEDRVAVYRGLLGVDELYGQGLARVRLNRSQVGRSQTLRADRWTRPATEWVTAYPIVLDRFVRRDDEVEPLLRKSCGDAGLPEPTEIEWSHSPLLPGTGDLRANQRVRRRSDQPRPALHARMRFAETVTGPVVLGNMRHYGLGLMLPVAR